MPQFNDLWAALALVLVIEGILPFASPKRWKHTLAVVQQMSYRQIRLMGFCCIVIGLILINIIR